MKFSDVLTATDALRTLLEETTGRELIAEITVPQPDGEEDELHFMKLTAWAYVLLVEAGQPALKHILGLLRTSDRIASQSASRTRETVINIRTLQSHNLASQDRGTEHKRRQTQIWFDENGGTPPDWKKCCTSLCAELVAVISSVSGAWRFATGTAEDSAISVSELLLAVDRNWPAHEFDPILEEATLLVGIVGLDLVSYRDDRLNDWRRLAAYFHDNESARSALRRAIATELANLFGAQKFEAASDSTNRS